MIITFATTNDIKFATVSKVLAEYGITLEQYDNGYPEYQSETFEQICRRASKQLAEELGKPVLVDDSGIFFHAYNNFPGPLARPIFEAIGLEGALKLLEGKERGAHYTAVLGYCEPGGEPVCFSADDAGSITEKIGVSLDGSFNERMPYDYIFIPKGCDRIVAQLPADARRFDSHRIKAARELGEYLKNK